MKLRLALAAAALAATGVTPAWSLDLADVWRAAATHDPEFAAARAARDAGATRSRQADALWRPTIALEAGASRASADSAMRGSRFAAPGFGQSDGVAFDTSVSGGTASRYGIALRQPLLNGERDAQARQLRIGAAAAGIEWRAAGQSLMVRSAELYFDLALAAEQLRLLRQQEAAVERARVEAQDRFRLGDRPVTDVHEAAARASALRAQRIAAENELESRRNRLQDLSGLIAREADLRLPRTSPAGPGESLEPWLERAMANAPSVRLAEAQLRQAEAALRKASGTGATLDLVAQAARDRLSGDGDFGRASTTSTQRAIGVQLSVPLYTGGWRSAKRDEAQALLARAQADLDRAREAVRQQVRILWRELAAGASQTGALEGGWAASRLRLDATRVGVQAGDRTTLDLLNAQNDTAAAELALTRARTQLVLQRLRLAALADELDEAALDALDRELRAPSRP